MSHRLPVTVALLFTATMLPLTVAAKTPTKKNIPVPYTLQAPQHKWVQPWEDACEEAATLMVNEFYAGNKVTRLPVDTAVAKLRQLIATEDAIFQHNKDTNADEMTRLINDFLPWEAFRVDKPNVEQIKSEIDNNRPVIALTYGKALKNPNFRAGGPDYHTLVLKGYDDAREDFIAHDPGIGRGLDYHYSYATMMAALHDFVPGKKTKTGTPVVLFTTKVVSDSKHTDGDKDGLDKAAEITAGTSLFSADTDHDGYKDGEEITAGYSPLVNERAIPMGSLLKTKDSSAVYFLGIAEKFPIASPEVADAHAWNLNEVKIVSQKFLDSLYTRDVIRQ